MYQQDQSRQLSFMSDLGSIEEPAQLYQLPVETKKQPTIQDQLDAIAQTPEGIKAIVQKSCDLVDDALANKGEVFKSPELVKKAFKARIGHLEHEAFAVLFLDSKHREVDFKIMFTGTVDGAAVYPREVVKAALARNAGALIVSHNHPSLDASPSSADISLTRRLKDTLNLVDVRLLDHIIVGAGEPRSLAEDDLM